MKKLLFTLLSTAAIVASAAYVRPALNTASTDEINASLASATTAAQKGYCTLLLRVKQEKIESFAQFTKMVDEVCDSFKLPNATKVHWKKFFALHHAALRPYIADACRFCIENPSKYDRVYLTRKFAVKSFTPEQRYVMSVKCLLEYELPPQNALALISTLIENSTSVAPEAVKAELVKINRKYSLFLVKDKAAWTPVVQAIRTALETY